MQIQNQIIMKLKKELKPEHLEVINESHTHNVPAGSETHFKVIVVSAAFEGMNRVKRHQAIYGILDHELKSGVHALSQHTFTPEEWRAVDENKLVSPNCRGGSSR